MGYYPASLFGGGQMATNATTIDYGGETLNNTAWPPMGSGEFGTLDYGRVAYHRDIYYFSGGAAAQEADLTVYQPCPGCYTVQTAAAGAPWNTYFYFGGPGGDGCPDAPQAPVTE